MPRKFANVLAVYAEATSTRPRLEAALRRAFPDVRADESGWIVATRPLGGRSLALPAPELAVWESDDDDELARLATLPIEALRPELPRAQGELGFARLEANGCFLAARSAGGWVPVYVARERGTVWLATSFEDLVRHREAEPRADALVQALWAEGNAVFPDGRTFLRGIECVPRGHAIHGTAASARSIEYWDPRPRRLEPPTADVAREHVEELGRALRDGLSESLSREGPNLLTLSGGVDSSSLAYLAHGLGFELATLTFVAPERSPARARQLALVRGVIADLGVRDARFVDAEDDVLEALFCRPLPGLFFCPHPALRLLPELGPATGSRVLFNGHFADEVTGYSQRLQDFIAHTRLRDLLNPWRPRPSGARDIARWLKRRALARFGRALLPFPREVGPWFESSVRAEVREWAEGERRRALADPRPLTELAAWCRLDGWLAMQWECCSRWGIKPSTPFFTRRVLELAFQCHPSELFGPGTKKILRAALRGQVPERYLERRDKGHWRVVRRTPMTRLEPDPDAHPGAGLPDEIREMLGAECPPTRAPLTPLEDRALNQLVLFSRKLREVRHAGYGREDTAPTPERGVRGAGNP